MSSCPNAEPSRARKKTIKARARKTNKRNRRGVVQTNETERNGAREDQLKLASLSSGVEVALLVSASIDWGKSVLISSRAASPSSVRSFVRRAAREPTGRNGTATDARGGRGANLTACRGGVRRTSSTSSTSTFGRSVGRRETARRFPAALRRSERRLRTRREKRANGARELHRGVRFAATDATRDGTSEDARRAGDAVCSGDCEMEQVLFSARGLEASWVNSGSFLIADGGSRGRGENKSDEGMAPAERENGIGARTRARASSSRVRAVGEQK